MKPNIAEVSPMCLILGFSTLIPHNSNIINGMQDTKNKLRFIAQNGIPISVSL